MRRTMLVLAAGLLFGLACEGTLLTNPIIGGVHHNPTTGGGGQNTGTAVVTIGDNFYDPASVVVTRTDAGARVTWTWTGSNPHTVTFDDGGASSDSMSTGSFSRTFPGAGTFTYFCLVHGRSVMAGTVTVQ